MAESGYAWAAVGAGATDRVALSPAQQAEVGYQPDFDPAWRAFVASRPGATEPERLRVALEQTLEDYDHDYERAVQDLDRNGRAGLIRFAPDGAPIGGKILQGAIRAARNTDAYPLKTADEFGAELGRVRSRSTAGAEMTRQANQRTEARRAAQRDLLERTTGSRDLRTRKSASRQERVATGQRARRENMRRATREATAARERAATAARRAARV